MPVQVQRDKRGRSQAQDGCGHSTVVNGAMRSTGRILLPIQAEEATIDSQHSAVDPSGGAAHQYRRGISSLSVWSGPPKTTNTMRTVQYCPLLLLSLVLLATDSRLRTIVLYCFLSSPYPPSTSFRCPHFFLSTFHCLVSTFRSSPLPLLNFPK